MKKVLLAVDGSEHSWKAAEVVCKLGQVIPLDLTVMHVVHDLSVYRPYGLGSSHERELDDVTRKRAEHVMERARRLLAPCTSCRVDYVVTSGEPADTLIGAADTGEYDTIVMGSRGMGRMAKLLVGSVSNKVVTHAPCSVLVIR